MELFDTYTKELVDMPLPPRPDPHVHLRPDDRMRALTSAMRGPSSSACGGAQWLKVTGYNVTFVHNITDVNDKIYDAAGDGPSADLAKQATEWYLEDTAALGLGMPDEMPKVSQNVPVIVEFIEELIEKEHAYEVEGDVYFRVASFEDYGKLSGRSPTSSRSRRSRTRRRKTRATSRSGRRRRKARTPPGTRRGASGRPGWHIECSAMAENILGRSSRSTAAASTCSSRTTRTSWRSRARSAMLRLGLGAQRPRPLHRREDVEVRRLIDHDPRGDRHVGPRGAADVLPRRPLAEAGRLLRGDDGAGAGARRDVPQCVHAAEVQAEAPVVGRLRGRARGRLRHAAGARRHARVGLERPARPAQGGARDLRAQVARRSRSRRPRRSWRSRRRAQAARARPRTSRRPTACAPSSPPPAGRCATASAATCCGRKR